MIPTGGLLVLGLHELFPPFLQLQGSSLQFHDQDFHGNVEILFGVLKRVRPNSPRQPGAVKARSCHLEL
jgi:hypothetical protein